ncbi:MAG: hypothetical protein RLZZ165_703, partial [Bacteroidota bacterium]
MIWLLSALVFACSGKPEPSKQGGGPPPTIVDVILAQPTAVSSEIEVNGEVAANEYVDLHPEVSGRLVYLHVPEGAIVSQGTVVARLNDA